MNAGSWIALIAAIVSNAIAFGLVLVRVGAIGQRLDLLWAWYLAEHGFERAVDSRNISPREIRMVAGRPRRDRAADSPIAADAATTP